VGAEGAKKRTDRKCRAPTRLRGDEGVGNCSGEKNAELELQAKRGGSGERAMSRSGTPSGKWSDHPNE